jgi:uncharacterized protein YbbK (DUF523 family)
MDRLIFPARLGRTEDERLCAGDADTQDVADAPPSPGRASVDPTTYLVSACLLGVPTAYDGHHRLVPELLTLVAQGRAVPICPEVAGGLPIPRSPAEIVGGGGEDVLDGRAQVMTKDGRDVTAAFVQGARRALEVARRHAVTRAVLKAHSPSCGARRIYEGTHSGRLVAGQGVTTALLRRAGLEVVSDEEFTARCPVP